MASYTTGGRLCRAATLRLLFFWALAGSAAEAFGQGFVDGGEYTNADPYVSNDVMPECESGGECVQYASSRSWGCWIGAEYLRWRLDGNDLPPLVTDSPSTTPIVDAGQLDEPDTRILIGNETVNDGWRNGYRLFAGMWLDECQCWAIGGDYFDLGDDDFNKTIGPDPDRIVTRPFFNTETGEDDAELVSVPGELDGTVEVSSSDDFQGAGLTLTHCLASCCDPCTGNRSAVKMLGGYRYYKYDSNLTITENLLVLPGTTQPLVPGTEIFVQDEFKTRNEFNGVELGLQGWTQRQRWWLEGMAKVAIGTNRRTVIVDGQTINTVPGAGSATFEGGLLTSEVTNIGHYHDSDTAVIPEFRLGIGRCVDSHCSIRAGYNVIVWGDVARAVSHLPPGLEVDPRNLPPVQAGGGPEPEFPGIRGSQLLAHGFDASVQWSF